MNIFTEKEQKEITDFLHKNSLSCFKKFKKMSMCLQTKGQYQFCKNERTDYDACLLNGINQSEYPQLKELANQVAAVDNSQWFDEYDQAIKDGQVPPVYSKCIGNSAIVDYMDQYQWFAYPDTQSKGIKYMKSLYVCALTAESKQDKLAKWIKCYDGEFQQKKFYSQQEFSSKFEKCGKELQ